nr:hypothetical protein [Tanacetum cinerariifolium]
MRNEEMINQGVKNFSDENVNEISNGSNVTTDKHKTNVSIPTDRNVKCNYSYANVAAMNCNVSNKLEIVPTFFENGNEVVVFDEELDNEGCMKWKLTLCGYFMDCGMGINELRKCLARSEENSDVNGLEDISMDNSLDSVSKECVEQNMRNEEMINQGVKNFSDENVNEISNGSNVTTDKHKTNQKNTKNSSSNEIHSDLREIRKCLARSKENSAVNGLEDISMDNSLDSVSKECVEQSMRNEEMINQGVKNFSDENVNEISNGSNGQSFAGTRTKGNATSSGGNNATGQERVVKCYNCQGERHMARQCTKPKRPRNYAWFKEKMLLVQAQESGQVLNEEHLEFLGDPGILDGQAIQTTIQHNAAFQTNYLDAYDSDCDDISLAKVVLMAYLSSYDLNVLSRMSKQISNQVTQWENKETITVNESLTNELERYKYKERVKTFEQRLNVDLNSHEKMIDSQIDDMIRNRNALNQEINSLKQTLSKQVKEKESLLE